MSGDDFRLTSCNDIKFKTEINQLSSRVRRGETQWNLSNVLGPQETQFLEDVKRERVNLAKEALKMASDYEKLKASHFLN